MITHETSLNRKKIFAERKAITIGVSWKTFCQRTEMDRFQNTGLSRAVSSVNIGYGRAWLEFQKRVVPEIGNSYCFESQGPFFSISY
jgi:hypothetical protein